MTGLGHMMILASAGSGKTYALTTRFVKLLAAGAPAERIVALTFTRKAAGEFFDEILNRLSGAAADAEAAERLAKEVGRPELSSRDFLRLLRAMVSAMPRLNLGTLDGFFARVVRSFPMELGLSGEFQLLEESAARRERARVLAALFEAGAATEAARTDFIEAFKRATYGVEEKALHRRLDEFLDEHGETFRTVPAGSAWGNPARIWPHGCPWGDGAIAVATAGEGFRASMPWVVFNDKQRDRIDAFLSALPEWVAGATLPKPVEYLLKNALEVWAELTAGEAEVRIERKKVRFEGEAADALVTVVRSIVAAELIRRIETTRGIHAVLQIYERVYDDQVRRAGRLTFADVQRLLQPDATAVDGDWRMLIDWRLDARFDHWLLDEFQDTSRGQWSILRNLIDEAVQDPEARRSFFYVGDVKQAIYAWRGGDSRLFREIFAHYNGAAPGAIVEARLDDSWRSGPAVVAMVNAVAGNAAALAEAIPGAVVDRWMLEWRTHVSARPNLEGYAGLRWAADEAGRFAETLRILQEVDAAGRGLTVAVLVQKNDLGARLAEFLRGEGGLAAIAESDLQVAFDNPFTCALLGLLRVAAHPGDTMAGEMVAMTPVARALGEMGWMDADQVSVGVLDALGELGYAGTLATWVKRMEPALAADDGFSRLRARQLVEAARSFDEMGGGQIAEFLEWIERHTLRESDSPGVVRVMTVHKSKGLGFDVVILPDLQGQSVAQRRRGLAVHRDADNEVDWVLDLPGKLLTEHDEALRAQVEAEEDESAYEALCKLYVALTRAKRALYVVIEPVGKSASRNFPKLLNAALGEDWESGDRDWFTRVELDQPIESGSTVVGDDARSAGVGRVPRRVARTPSDSGEVVLSGRKWFSVQSEDRAAWGTAVHALFAMVEWSDDLDLDAWSAESIASGSDEAVVGLVRRCLGESALGEVFRRPAGGSAVVWRERAFEVVRDGEWITGVFDRVVVALGPDGRAREAWVYDFKTDAVADEGAARHRTGRYAGQLNLYRDVVSRLTGLELSRVSGAVVFTALATTVVAG